MMVPPADNVCDSQVDWLYAPPSFQVWLQEISGPGFEVRPPSIPGLLTLPHFFQQCCPLTAPFSVFAYKSRQGGSKIQVQRLWDEKSLGPIQAALDELRPFEWDTWNVSEIKDRWTARSAGYQKCYLFGRDLWTLTKADEAASADHLRFLFLAAIDRERARFERLKRQFSGAAGSHIRGNREPIPEDVRIYVWRRDQGRCVSCGSQNRLEYDHIIPVSKGGSSTERNIQLLCEACNRAKSDHV